MLRCSSIVYYTRIDIKLVKVGYLVILGCLVILYIIYIVTGSSSSQV
jgi:hypothetical protein